MIKGKTKSGFSYELDKERLNNYELLEAIGRIGRKSAGPFSCSQFVIGKRTNQKILKTISEPKTGLSRLKKCQKKSRKFFKIKVKQNS